jgi:hypothetical protein
MGQSRFRFSREEAERKADTGDFVEDEIADLQRVLGTDEFINRDWHRRIEFARSSLEVSRAIRDAGTTEPIFVDPNWPPRKKPDSD